MPKSRGYDPVDVSHLLDDSAPAEGLSECHAWLRGPADTDIPDVAAEQLLATVEAAVQRNAAEHLERLRERNVPKQVRKAASRGIHRLRSQGLSIEAQRTPTSFSLQTAELDRLESAWFAQFHAGLWHVFLTTSDSNRAVALTGVVQGPDSVNSLQHSQTTRSGIRKAWRHWAADEFLVQYDFDVALGILHHAIDRSFSPTSVPEDWRRFLQVVDRERISRSKELDWTSGLPSEFERSDLGTTDEIRSETHRRILLLDDTARGRLLERMLEVANSDLEVDGDSKADEIRDALLEELDALMDDDVTRADWIGRLNLTALHAQQANDVEGVRLFRASALALGERYKARDVPLLSRLIEPFTSYGKGGPMPDLRPVEPDSSPTIALPDEQENAND